MKLKFSDKKWPFGVSVISTFNFLTIFGDIFVFEEIVRVFCDVYLSRSTSRFHSGKGKKTRD